MFISSVTYTASVYVKVQRKTLFPQDTPVVSPKDGFLTKLGEKHTVLKNIKAVLWLNI